jgi:hypothetical protein
MGGNSRSSCMMRGMCVESPISPSVLIQCAGMSLVTVARCCDVRSFDVRLLVCGGVEIELRPDDAGPPTSLHARATADLRGAFTNDKLATVMIALRGREVYGSDNNVMNVAN